MRSSILFLLFALLAAVIARADDVAARVVILANSAEPDSVKLAEYYAGKRGVPVANIIALPMPITEAITWPAFVDTILSPLQQELVRQGWLDAIAMNLFDNAGRRKYAMSGHKISYFVVCRGVPLKIVDDPNQPDEKTPVSGNPAFQSNAAAVDAELALLAMSNPPLIAFVPNPLFNNEHPSAIQLNQIVKVGRLDGPAYEDAKRLIDNALEAEATGLIGRSYVDIGGPHALGDRWLEDAAKQLAALDYDGDVERAGGSMPPWTRMDAPALYFGWYAGDLNGPFVQPGFKFPAGAVALHIHSYSADTVRSTTRGWVGPLVARGVTATFGNVTEPYLELTHQPQLILQALARGETLGDAAAYAVPVYSWQGMCVGDPLYRPFKVAFEEQWARREKLPPDLRAYVVLRQMHQLEKSGDRNAAIWTGLESQKNNPCLAVALTTAELQSAAEDPQGAKQSLSWVTTRRSFTATESPLAVLAARQFSDGGDAKAAFGIWQRVLGGRLLSKEVRIEWLKPAIEAARAAKDNRQVVRWDEELRELTAPAPTPMP